MHRADHHVDLVALDQLGGVFRRLGRIGFIVDLEVLDLAPAELAALLLHIHAEAILDGGAERRVGSRVRQHEADLDLAARRSRRGLCGLGRSAGHGKHGGDGKADRREPARGDATHVVSWWSSRRLTGPLPVPLPLPWPATAHAAPRTLRSGREAQLF
ncbi:hypothetical protein D3C72_1246900 [compost metagenome]